MALERRPRVSCQLRCEIVQGRKRTPATVVTLSEGGIGIKTNVALEEGDEVRVCLLQARGHPIDLRALVWNEAKRFDSRGRTSLRTFGCVVSDPPAAFLRVIDQMRDREPPTPRKRARPLDPEPLEIVEEAAADPELPRPRTPLPPHKPDPEEARPTLRLRVKQGPRSRRLDVPAQSLLEAQIWIRQNLEGEWEILEIAGINGGRSKARSKA